MQKFRKQFEKMKGLISKLNAHDLTRHWAEARRILGRARLALGSVPGWAQLTSIRHGTGPSSLWACLHLAPIGWAWPCFGWLGAALMLKQIHFGAGSTLA